MMAEIIVCVAVLAVLIGLVRRLDAAQDRRPYTLREIAEAGLLRVEDVPHTAPAPSHTCARRRVQSLQYHTSRALAEVRHALHEARSEVYVLALLEIEAELEVLVTTCWREAELHEVREGAA